MSEKNFVDDCVNFYKTQIYPALFTDIERAPIWPVVTVATIIYLLSSEINTSLYDSRNNVEQTISDRIDKVIDHIAMNHEAVEWRRVLLISIFLSLVILYLFNPKFPDGFDFFLVTFLIFLVLYPISNLFSYYWHESKDGIHKEKLLKLRNQVVGMEIEEEIKNKHVYYEGYPEVMDHINSIISSIH